MKRLLLLLLGTLVVCWTFAARADSIPGDSGMDSGGCDGSIHMSTLSMSFSISIATGGTGSFCLENVSGIRWGSIAITAPPGSFPLDGGEGGFGCGILEGSPFTQCIPPTPPEGGFGPGDSATWLFFGGGGVFPCPDETGEYCAPTTFAHVRFDLTGFKPGDYTFMAQAEVPEPGTIALLLPGAGILFLRRRRPFWQ